MAGGWKVRAARATVGRPRGMGRGRFRRGSIWEESWVSVTYLTADLRAEARRLEAELFGPRATRAGGPIIGTGRAPKTGEGERGATVPVARAAARDRAPPPSSP